MSSERCHATSKSTGRQCQRRAMLGQRVCDMHGGKSPQALAAARRRLEEKAARDALVRFGLAPDEEAPEDLDPRRCLLEELFRSWRTVRQLEAELARVDAVSDTGKPHPLFALWNEQRSHFRAVAETTHKAGIEDWRVSLESAHAQLLAELLRGVFGDPRLHLAVEQRELAATIAAERLRLLESGGEDVDAGA